MHGRYAGESAGPARGRIVLRTARLILIPLRRLDEAEHARASKNPADALRDTRAAELQWREHGFGPWAIRDRRDESFLGGAELRLAGHGIEGIAPDEVEAGWWVTEQRRREGIATEAMEAAIDDLWGRTDVEIITAYIEEGANEPSRRLAASLGFAARGPGRGRSGEPMTVYEVRRDDWLSTRTLKPTGREWPGRACSHVTRLFWPIDPCYSDQSAMFAAFDSAFEWSDSRRLAEGDGHGPASGFRGRADPEPGPVRSPWEHGLHQCRAHPLG